MADETPLCDLLRGTCLDQLRAECTDEHLIKISKWFGNWRDFSADLGLTEVQEEEIEARRVDLNRKKLDMLRMWKRQFTNRATYYKLAEVFHEHNRNDLVTKLQHLFPAVEDDAPASANGRPQAQAPLGPAPPIPVGCMTGSQVLQTNYSKLVEGMQDPESLADVLYSNGIISKKVLDEVHQEHGVKKKSRALLAAVEQQVTTNPSTYKVFRAQVLQDRTLSGIWPLLPASTAPGTH